MAKLYAVTSGRYSDYGIITLCSDKERAENIVRWYNRYEKYDKASVEEYEDGVVVPDESLIPYEVAFDVDGNIRRIGTDSSPMRAVYGDVVSCYDGRFIVHVLATDEATAIKIAAEKRAFHLAQKEGI